MRHHHVLVIKKKKKDSNEYSVLKADVLPILQVLVLLRSAFCKRSLLQVDDELEIKAYYAGHVLGAAMVLIKVGSESVVYTVSATHLVYNVMFIYSWMNQHRSGHQSQVCRLYINKNNRRPKIEPCGTPCFHITPLMLTN